MVSSDVTVKRLGLPAFSELPGNSFASVESFLQFQRQAVGGARYAVELDADAVWQDLSAEGRLRFETLAASLGLDQPQTALWRRAWWLHAIGGRARAPFEIATPTELAEALGKTLREALAPQEPPGELSSELEVWWREITAASREQIARYTSDRVAAAARRLRTEGVISDSPEPGATVEPELLSGRRRRARRPPSRSEIGRVRAAAERSVAAQDKLDRRFASLGPVCGACTRETGGCCSLTVPLLWRETDYRLLALGGNALPEPSDSTAGACPFLGQDGCRLPAERRPHICRSFLCEKAEAALGSELAAARQEIDELGVARSQLIV
jgi:hypothetical protein